MRTAAEIGDLVLKLQCEGIPGRPAESWWDIVEGHARDAGVQPVAVVGNARTASIVRARHACYRNLRALGYSIREVARGFDVSTSVVVRACESDAARARTTQRAKERYARQLAAKSTEAFEIAIEDIGEPRAVDWAQDGEANV